MRPQTNLKSNPEFAVKKAELRHGFLGFYNGRLGANQYEILYRIVAAALFPFANKAGSPDIKELKKLAEKNLRDKDRKYTIHSTLRYDSASKSFEFRTPFYRQFFGGERVEPPTEMIYAAYSYLKRADNPYTDIPLSQLPVAIGTRMTGAQLAAAMQASQMVKDATSSSIKFIEAETAAGHLTLWATFRISQKEAEYLNNTAADQIKLGNFYPALLEWASSTWGEDGNVPSTITPIAYISKEVKAVISRTPVKPRVGVDGMVMDINNNILFIPEVDNSALYEQRMMDFGLREGGVYTWGRAGDTGNVDADALTMKIGVSPSGGAMASLPINMPIFTDWLNDKFAYSNTAGNLAVYDLSNTVPASNYHLLKVLHNPVTPEPADYMSVVKMAVQDAASYDNTVWAERPTAAELAEIRKIMPANREFPDDEFNRMFGRNATSFGDVVTKALMFHNRVIGHTADFFVDGGRTAPRAHQLHFQTGLITMRWVGRIIKKAMEMIEGNLDAMYRRHSVLNVLQQVAVLRVLVNHSPRSKDIEAADAAERDPYTTQGVDPEYQVGPISLVKKDLKFMPHQAKVDNLMRKHPKSAVYAVAAGGGKTILILTNILREIKAGICKKPLVMCPTHLVAQYVEEVVYVTEGRLNIIPVTNVTLKSHGYDGLQKMIENAPPNTIVVTDYDYITRKSEDVAYGNKTVTVYRNAEFLRQFEFDLVALDESHYLKNLSSGRRDAAARLIQDIPYKRLASGTFVADTIKDIVSQIALIDPTIFGSEEQFKREFAAETRGNKVLAWKEGAEREVRARIAEHVVYAEAKRKEWAVLLPKMNEEFFAVELTENQRLLYESILAETLDMIKEALSKRQDLADAEEQKDETKAEELERLLRPYMARLERFLAAPELDPAGQIFLKSEDDRQSPKLKMVYQRIQEHIDQKIPGKCLVFTQYLPSAEACYLNAPAGLRDSGIHYTADNKVQARSDFEQDASKLWMVGQSSSMDTGLNFQHVSRLIRLETVWTPGVLEQGNSRVNRPQLKKDEIRKEIWFDWILVNRTIDVTKISRLMAKVISKGKFDEHDNPRFQEIDNLPPTPITLESIAANNDFQNELVPYLLGFEKYQTALQLEYDEYREKHGDKLEPVPVPPGGMLEGSKLMARVPYIPGMNIYGTTQLGLLRYDQFVRQDIDTVDDADIEDDKDDEDDLAGDDGAPLDPKEAVRRAQKELRAKERVLAKFKPCHTEFGDGEITAIGNKFVRVRLANGGRARLEKLKVFIVTRTQTSNKDMRNELLKMVGDLPIDHPIEVPADAPTSGKKVKKGDVPIPPKAEQSITLSFSVINDMLAVVFNPPSAQDPALSVLQNLGFQMAPEYAFSRMQNHRVLLRLFRAWADAGFKITPQISAVFKDVYNTYKLKGKSGIGKFGFATQQEFRNFYREEIKPSANPTELKVYPQIQDGELFVIMPVRGQTGNLKAMRVPVQSVRWKLGGGDTEYVKFVQTKEQAKNLVKDIINRGVKVANLEELGEQFKSIKMGKKAD